VVAREARKIKITRKPSERDQQRLLNILDVFTMTCRTVINGNDSNEAAEAGCTWEGGRDGLGNLNGVLIPRAEKPPTPP